MGWFWSDSQTNSGAAAKCPVDHSKPAVCPIDHSKSSIAVCPVKPSNDDAVFNPMNNMPLSISSERAPGQKITLSTERTISSIPRGESEDLGSWEYPSPQQMLNAMLKKGKGEGVDEEAVTSMVDVHNFLNEGAWYQILEWEVKHTKETKVEPRLLKFTGRPHDLSPRAQMYLWLGNLFPERFNTQPPFDRHDWTVLRSRGRDQGWDQVRYVIDYYGAPDDEETGMPSFMLDTRPALDSPQSAVDRFTHWSQPLWKKAMGETEE